MTFKHKLGIATFLALIVFCIIMYFHGLRIWECKSTGWQLGRGTEYSIITGKCAMETGRVDSNGEPIMVIQSNDRGVGGETGAADDSGDDSE